MDPRSTDQRRKPARNGEMRVIRPVRPILICCLLVAALLGEIHPAAAQAEIQGDELVTEPLLLATPEPTATRRATARRREEPDPFPYGWKPQLRKYGGGQGRVFQRASRQPRANPLPEVEVATEPLRGSEEDRATPIPAAPPRSSRTDPDAKQFSVSALGAEPSQSAPASGYSDPDLPRVPLSGRELTTEPLWGGDARGAAGTPLQFRSEVDRAALHVDESFTLTLEVAGPDLKGLSAPKPPAMPNFDLINSYHADTRTNSEGNILQVKTFHYVFLPLQPGKFTVPPARLQYRGQTYLTQPLTLEVEGPRTGIAYQRQFSGGTSKQPRILAAAPDTEQAGQEGQAQFSARLDASQVFVNQRVILSVHLRYEIESGVKVTYTPPLLTGLLSEELSTMQTQESLSGGRQRYVEKTYRTALFPLYPGTLTIGPARVTFLKWMRKREQATESLGLEVKALPPDPEEPDPETRSGLVGKYRLSAKVVPEEAPLGTPVLLQIRLQGEGNIRSAPKPIWPASGAYRLQLEKEEEKIDRSHSAVAGEKLYQYLLISRKPGWLEPGTVKVRYFDPEGAKWAWAQVQVPKIRVLPPVQVLEVKTPAAHGMPAAIRLRPNHTGPERLRRDRPAPVARPGFWLLQAGGMAMVLLALLGRRWYRQTLADPRAVRARRAYRTAKRAMKEAARYIRGGETGKFYDCIARIASEYLAAKFGLSTSSIIAERLPEYFERYGVPGAFQPRFKVTLTACEYVRYAAVELPAHDMRSLYRDLHGALNDFERFWRKRAGGRKKTGLAVALALACLGLAGTARAGEAELYFMRGNVYADQGQYEAALAEYQKVFSFGVSDPDLFYNLGNTYVRLGEIGRAVLAYERGLRLAPRDADLRYNLAQVTARTSEARAAEALPGLGSGALRVYRMFTASELAWTASGFYFLFLTVLILLILKPTWSRLLKRGLLVSAMILGILGAWTAARTFEPGWWKRGVVLVAETSVRGRPYKEADRLYTVTEGTGVEIEREEEEWVEVRFGGNRHGWIPRSAVGFIP